MEIFLDFLVHASILFNYSPASLVITLLILCKILISFAPLYFKTFCILSFASIFILVKDMEVARGRFFIVFYLLFTCPKANFGPLQEGRLTHPMLITRIWIKIREEYSAVTNYNKGLNSFFSIFNNQYHFITISYFYEN